MPDRVVPGRDLTPEEEAVLSDELLRERIRQIRGEPRPQSRWEKISRHPLAAVITGFCLTGVIGLLLSQSVNSAREERERRMEEYRTGLAEEREGLVGFASIVFERHALAMRLWTGLNRGASASEVDALRNEYEKSVVRWGPAMPTALFMIRRITRSDEYSEIENVVEGRLEYRFQEADDSLLAAYDRFKRGSTTGDLGRARTALDEALACGAQITETLYQLSGQRAPPADGPGVAGRLLPRRSAVPVPAGRATDSLEDLHTMCPR